MLWWHLIRFRITNPRERERMLKIWSANGESKLVPLFILGLKDASPAVRKAAATALKKFPDDRAIDGLANLLKDPDAGIREEAAHALGTLGDPRIHEPLV